MSLSQQSFLSRLRGRCCWVVGCGFLGSGLLDACRAAGMHAIGIDRERPAEVQGSASEQAVLCRALVHGQPEFVFCCVATHGGDEAAYRATYLDIPRALHAVCPEARLIFCSSSSVYGGQMGEVVTELSPCLARSAKAQLLLQAESAVLSAGGVVARLVPLYGDGRCELLRRMVQREPELPGEDGRVFNYVHRDDAAQALLSLAAACLTRTCPPVVNVCGESFTRGEVYAALHHLTGLPRVAETASGSRRGAQSQQVSPKLLESLGWRAQERFVRWASTSWKQWC